ncbi:MAG TPA: LLM class flavin-dependent oxidoreductase [Candidatus Binatia bacterium]|jgi:alkanesulfonate monooxygenase SsuD/methylene tetrahydromethanopterin reductase-like flavin-dependent oxidoreductase (luciferase family)|nr:LLM class flavin-dependent oxidoreductase [Candidatus Binatia bacterium]
MNVGLLFPFRNPPQWRKPFPQFYAEQLRQVRLAEELGYDTIWLTEHHFAEDGYSPALLPIAGAIAGMTSRVRIGTFLLLLPLHNAVRVGEDAATVDVIANGRFDLGLGQGYAPSEFDGYGIPRNERASRMEEGIAVIKGMWTQDPFSYEGKHYHLKNISLMPKPAQTPHPPLWIGARGKKAVERAARLGCHFLGTGDPTSQRIYDDALRSHGHDPKDYHAAQLRWAYVAPTHDQAWDDTQEHLHYMLTWYGRWLAEAKDFKGDERFTQLPPPAELRHSTRQMVGAPMIGTPEEVAGEIEQLTKEMRTTHLVMGMHLPGIDPAKSQRSMELFAKEVTPRLR